MIMKIYSDQHSLTFHSSAWFKKVNNQNTCLIKLKPQDDIDSWIFGLNFLRAFYTVYDYEKQQIGIAQSKGYSSKHDGTEYLGGSFE